MLNCETFSLTNILQGVTFLGYAGFLYVTSLLLSTTPSRIKVKK